MSAWPSVARSRWTRAALGAARRLALALVAAAVTYLALANLTLSLVVRPRLSEASLAGMRVSFGSAYSLLPGYVHLADLTVAGELDGTPWELSLDRAVARVRLHELLFRRLHVPDLHGSGVTLTIARHTSGRLARGAAFPAARGAALPYGGARDDGGARDAPAAELRDDDDAIRFEGEGEVGADFSIEHGQLANGSTLRVSAPRVDLAGVDAEAALEGGVVASLERTEDGAVAFMLRAPRATIVRAGRSMTGEDVLVRVEARDGGARSWMHAPLEVRAAASRADVPIGAAIVAASGLRASFRIERRPSGSAAADVVGSIESAAVATSPRTASEARAAAPLYVAFPGALVSLQGGLILEGPLEIRGGDASLLADVVGLEGAPRRFVAASSGIPFVLHADVLRGPGVLSLRGLRVTSGDAELRGDLCARGGRRAGVFILRVGPASASVALSGRALAVARPPRGWVAPPKLRSMLCP